LNETASCQAGQVLVVEDDPAVCALLSDIVEQVGLAAMCVRTDRAATAALASKRQFLAVIVDVNLGQGTTGFDVARFARERRPEVPVIYTTGDDMARLVQLFAVADSDFLRKPFAPGELIEILRGRGVV
jgi:CheY-like chemotaxis protein